VRIVGLLLAALLGACVPPETSCSERDISSWTPATVEFGVPVKCGGKTVGYQLDIDASDGTSRVWEMVQLDPPDASGALSVSADITLLTPVERSVRIEQGPTKLSETIGALSTVSANAVATPGRGNVLRAIRVIVPGGTHYRGEVRAVTWR